jgi:hypothetical protein
MNSISADGSTGKRVKVLLAELGTSGYVRTAHTFVSQPRGPGVRPRSYFRSPGLPSRRIAHSLPVRLDLL